MKKESYIDYLSTPLGILVIEGSDVAITRVSFSEQVPPNTKSNSLIDACQLQLQEYFENKRKTFALPLEFSGTDFQKLVWTGLQKIHYGQTCSYRDLAEKIGRPQAVRAVGSANGCNPIAIIVPCHRVIGRDGSLTGYAWGLERKRWLLEHEGAIEP